MQQEQSLVRKSPQKRREDWVDSVVEVAQTCKKLFTRHTCRVCQVYVDEQVEFEIQQQENRSWHDSALSMMEVELYRQFLFDEDSVVEGVSERRCEQEEQEEEPHTNQNSQRDQDNAKNQDDEQSDVSQRSRQLTRD